MGYYDGTKLLSLKDVNGNQPEIYICTSNRSGGKTTYFGRYLVNRFLKYGEKFGLLYRYEYEISDAGDKFYKQLQSLFFSDTEMSCQYHAKQKYSEMFLNGVSCGYAIALNCADTIKKYSHLYSDIVRLLMDEFQSETSNYCPKEIEKFQSIHYSLARGNGKQYRYLPTIMLSNPVTLLNPYYVALGISSRLSDETKFMRGNGWVLEQGYNETASLSQKNSGFYKAFNTQQNNYAKYSTEAVYLNDQLSFIDKVEGKNKYICTLKYMNKEFAVREYSELGFLYVNKVVDSSFNNRICVTTSDHDINYVMLKTNAYMIQAFRQLFSRGAFRFADLECKECLIQSISY